MLAWVTLRKPFTKLSEQVAAPGCISANGDQIAKWIFQGTTDEEDNEYETEIETEIETEAIIADDDEYEYETGDEETDVPFAGKRFRFED